MPSVISVAVSLSVHWRSAAFGGVQLDAKAVIHFAFAEQPLGGDGLLFGHQ